MRAENRPRQHAGEDQRGRGEQGRVDEVHGHSIDGATAGTVRARRQSTKKSGIRSLVPGVTL